MHDSFLFSISIVDPKSIIFECQRLWEILGFSFNLTWKFPDYVGNAIYQFHVDLKLTDGTENISIPVLDSRTFSLQNLEVLKKYYITHA